MKKFYSFFAMLFCMLCSLTANAQTNNKAYLFAKGSFYTVSVASDANPRVDVSTGGEQPGGVYVALGFNATDNPFNIKAQNESKSFFVYKNGVAVENTQKGIDANMFDAQVTLANNDVVKVFSSKPMQTTVYFGFMNGTFDAYANQVEVAMDKVVAVPNYHEVANVLEGTEFQVKAKEGYEIESVTYCNNDITPVDGVYSFVVNEANPLCNITMKQAKPAANAVLYLKGDKFYTFSIQDQNAADPREEIYSETLAGKVVDKYVGLNVNDGMSVRLVGNIKEGSTFAVYHNGVKVESIQQDMFEATLNLNPSSVLKVYDAEPMKTVVNIGFMNAGPTRIWASQVDVTKDVIIPVADITNPISVDLGTKISIKAKEGYEIVDVTYCNEPVTPVDGVYSFQVYAENTLANITMKEAAKTATAYVNGQFHTITASNAEGEALNVTQGTYTGDYFPFAPGKYTLRSYNEANEFHVYLDGAAVANTIDTGSTGFLAEIDVKDGSVLKLFNAAPFTSKVEFGSQGMPVAKLAELVEVTMDKVVSHNITNAVQALKGTEFAIKAKAGNEITEVIVNNQPIYPNDGVYTAKVSQEGDMLVIINMKDSRKTAYAYLNGNIYTATVSDKSIEDPKSAEILNVIYQEGYDEYREMKFNETSSAFVVKATTASNAPFVYVDGVKYESTAEEGNPYEAEVTLNNNSVLKIYDVEPFTTNMQIGFMGSRAKDAQKVVVTMDKVTPVDVTLDQVYNVLQGTEFQITTKKGYGYEIKSVTVNNTPVYPSGDVYKVKASQEGDMLINIEMLTDEKQAKAYINGQFNTFTATDAASEGGRDQILDVTQGDNYDEYRTMNFVPGHRYNLKGQNKNSNTFFVYLNGKAIPSTGIAGEMYEAQIELNENDILKVYDAEPFNTKMEISFMQSRTEVAHQVDVTYDQVNKVSTTALQYPETSVFVVSKGTEFAIKAKDGYQIAGVYYCNEPLYPDYNNVYKVKADREGDALVVIDMKDSRNEAIAFINGTIYTFTATPAASEGSRDQILDVTMDTYENEYRTMKFEASQNPFNLKGQDEDNELYVYLNGEKLESHGLKGEMFEKQVYFNAGDVLKIYSSEPFTTDIEFGFMGSRAECYPMVEVVMDKNTSVDVSQDVKHNVLQGTEFQVKAKDGYVIKSVTVCNEPVVPVNGVYTFNANIRGDMLANIDVVDEAAAINNVNAETVNNGKMYSITGMAIKNGKTPGLYIKNGKKYLVK